ncbi:MAG: cytochrome P450 [Iamia sp.]
MSEPDLSMPTPVNTDSEAVAAGQALSSGLDPFAPGFYDDPYVQYRHLRETEPVHHSPLGLWFLSRWADCHHVLRLPGTSVNETNSILQERNQALAAAAEDRGLRRSRSILGTDPPDHTRIRKLVSKAFTPRTIARLEERVAEVVDDRLDVAAADDGPVDLIAGLAFPLPFQVIHEMLGMPDTAEATHIRGLSQTVTQVLDPVLAMTQTEAIFAAGEELGTIIDDAVRWKRDHPGDDLLTALVEAEDDGTTLSDEELRDNVTLLFLAGHETTVNLIGNGLLALLRHPDQAAMLRDDPALDAGAIEELLRYDSPVQFSRRIALEPFEVAGVQVETGELVLTGLGASNRDPAKFGPTAEELDITRADAHHHISFGSGIHHCLGAALARLEGRQTIPRVLRRFPEVELATDTIEWNGRMVLRGVANLPVTLGPDRGRA